MSGPFPFPAGLTARDKWTIGGGLAAVCGLAWAATAWQADAMMAMDAGGGAAATAIAMARPPLAGIELVLVYLMWAVMMVAMMVPGASPMVAVFAAINRRRRAEGDPFVRTSVFLLGYLGAWSLFSLVATGLHWVLDATRLLTPMMESASPALSATLFAAAGLYQWTPIKDVCLKHCRTPIGFVLSEWRDGTAGAIVMGLRHGPLLHRLLLRDHRVAVRCHRNGRSLGRGGRDSRHRGEAAALASLLAPLHRRDLSRRRVRLRHRSHRLVGE